MNKQFQQAVIVLKAAHENFAAGAISSVAHSRQRESALAGALHAMAASFSVQLKGYLHINARGEFDIFAEGKYGEFAQWLNKANPRCGMYPPAMLTPDSSWCYMNHFDVERMVLAYFAAEAVKPKARNVLARRLAAALAMPTAMAMV